MYRNTSAKIQKAIEKMDKDELTIEDILDNDELVESVKSNPNSQLAPL
jgi:hypothetical protein